MLYIAYHLPHNQQPLLQNDLRPRHLVSPSLRGGGRGGRAVAGLSPPPRPPLHLFRSPSPTHGTL